MVNLGKHMAPACMTPAPIPHRLDAQPDDRSCSLCGQEVCDDGGREDSKAPEHFREVLPEV